MRMLDYISEIQRRLVIDYGLSPRSDAPHIPAQGPLVTLPFRKRPASAWFERLVNELQAWRDKDHEDAKVLTRNEIIEILEGIKSLRLAQSE